jgi:hypothetical protein
MTLSTLALFEHSVISESILPCRNHQVEIDIPCSRQLGSRPGSDRMQMQIHTSKYSYAIMPVPFILPSSVPMPIPVSVITPTHLNGKVRVMLTFYWLLLVCWYAHRGCRWGDECHFSHGKWLGHSLTKDYAYSFLDLDAWGERKAEKRTRDCKKNLI